MGKRSKSEPDPPITRRIRRATTPEERENQLIAMAVDRAEQRLMDGTATAQEIIHFLRLGSLKTQLEMEKLKKENLLLTAKTDAINDERKDKEMFAKAIAAMTSYRPPTDDEEDEE
ncbi:MAG: hypothetical protein J6U54_12600 [Clostridiales bacterium]|nr:hypothetical protein [Clostridiales bacterium]